MSNKSNPIIKSIPLPINEEVLELNALGGEGGLFYNPITAGAIIQAEFLMEILRDVQPRRIIETGTHMGHFCYLAKLTIPTVEINTFGIDPRSEQCIKNLNKFIETPEIKFYKGDSTKTLMEFAANNKPLHYDFAWIDGGHTKEVCLSDLRNVAILGTTHICIDDCRLLGGVNVAVKQFLSEHKNYKFVRETSNKDDRGIYYLRRNSV